MRVELVQREEVKNLYLQNLKDFPGNEEVSFLRNSESFVAPSSHIFSISMCAVACPVYNGTIYFFCLIRSRNYRQERPTQIYYVLYTVGGM